MAATNTSDDSTSPDNPIRTVLRQNDRLATLAYNRTAGYRADVRNAANNQYNLSLTKADVRDTILEVSRLGLLREWANTNQKND